MQFIICDLSQIEARVLLTLVKDTGQLEQIRSGVSVYEAHARASMGWMGGVLKKEDPKRYLLAKARVLALGYGCGWNKFITMAYQPAYLDKDAKEVFSMPVTDFEVLQFQDFLYKYGDKIQAKKWNRRSQDLEREWVNSWKIVTDFRQSNRKITKLWAFFDKAIKACHGSDYSILLPSGRELIYRNVRVEDDICSAVTVDKDKWKGSKLYGGLLVENVVQAIARDIFRDACLRIEDAGYAVVCRIHDEALCEVPKGTDPEIIRALMSAPVSWFLDCPVDAEAKTADKYKK
jgi:DNA polymerase